MTTNNNNQKRPFYVVQFVEQPFEGIDNYVIIPYSWVILRRSTDHIVAVAYPKHEHPTVTKNRAKNGERYDDEWRFFSAIKKHESDTYDECERWITTENNRCSAIDIKSKTKDKDDNLRSSLSSGSSKRPVSSKRKEHLNKRLKLKEGTKSTITTVNIEPECSNREQSITIRNNELMDNAHTQETTATSNDKNKYNEVMDCDEEVLPVSITEQIPSFSQIRAQSAKQPKSLQEQQISAVPSTEKTCDNQDIRTDDFSNNRQSTSHQVPESLKMSDEIYNHMKGKSTLVATQKPIQKKIVIRNSPNDLMNPTSSVSEQPSMMTQHQLQGIPQVVQMQTRNSFGERAPSKSNVNSSQKNPHVFKINVGRSHDLTDVDSRNVLQIMTNTTTSASVYLREYVQRYNQNQYLPDNSNNIRQVPQWQTLQNMSTKSNIYDSQVDSPNIRIKIPSIDKDSSNVPNQLCSSSEIPQQRQSPPTYQESQQQQRTTKEQVGISLRPQNNRPSPALQEAMKRMKPSISMNVQNSIGQAHSSTHNNYLPNEQRPTNKYMVEQPLSLDRGVFSDTEAASDGEIISDPEKPADEAHNESQPTHPRAVLEQRMLDQFATLFKQMGTTLKHTSTMYKNLRRSILESAVTYKSLLDSVETFNALSNLASAAHSSSHMATEVPEVVQERHSGVAGREDSSDDDRHINDAVNEALNQRYNNSWRFVLPPEYDPHDSKWTLKYRKNMPGLIELLPRSGVYVSYDELKYAERISNSCRTLARRLLLEVFSKRALSVCLSMNETSQTSNNMGSQVRPSLDAHASMVLFNFVLKCGHERGWDTNTQAILSGIRSMVQEIRFKHGVMAKC